MSENKEYYIYINGAPYAINREIYEYITKSDRKIKYAEEDRKQERYFIDCENERISVKPSREDSLDRLMELGIDFPDKTIDLYESVTQKIMLEQALSKLDDEERNLIIQLFYFDRTETELAQEYNQTQQNINKAKQRILCKLYEILK